MTVGELINVLTTAYSMSDVVYVDNSSENSPTQLEYVDKNAYAWGFVLGKVDME